MLDGADHLAGVGVFVVVPGHDLDWKVSSSILETMVWVASKMEPKRLPMMSEETISSSL